MYFMRYSSLSLWVGELWFYHQGFRYCIFQALCFSGSYNLYHLHGFTFRTTENFSSFAYSFIFIRNVCEQRHAPSFLTVFALFFFLSEKEKTHWTMHCCIVVEWLKAFSGHFEIGEVTFWWEFFGRFLHMVADDLSWRNVI